MNIISLIRMAIVSLQALFYLRFVVIICFRFVGHPDKFTFNVHLPFNVPSFFKLDSYDVDKRLILIQINANMWKIRKSLSLCVCACMCVQECKYFKETCRNERWWCADKGSESSFTYNSNFEKISSTVRGKFSRHQRLKWEGLPSQKYV